MFDNIIEDYSPQKTENKKTKAKNYYQAIKKTYKKDSASIILIFLKMGKLKKNMLKLEILVREMQIEKEKKYKWKITTTKEKFFWII